MMDQSYKNIPTVLDQTFKKLLKMVCIFLTGLIILFLLFFEDYDEVIGYGQINVILMKIR